VRIQLPAVRQSDLADLLAMQVRARSGDNAGQLVPVSEVVQVAETRASRSSTTRTCCRWCT
jgi:hypothetical protein